MYAYAKDKKEEAFTFLTVREMLEITTHDMKGLYKPFSTSYGPHPCTKKSVSARTSKYTPKEKIALFTIIHRNLLVLTISNDFLPQTIVRNRISFNLHA